MSKRRISIVIADDNDMMRSILRAMLRQAPNVILVGEIRDKETAEIAVQAALTPCCVVRNTT